ncbi:MAG: hypothetical protein HAW67_04920 [Endozoicomonadaceae bacterium]|nr:hypothetical protein [Endozoicomonadaceae bacterium]
MNKINKAELTVDGLLEKIAKAENLADLRFDLGVGHFTELNAVKYSDRRCKGRLIDNIKLYENGMVHIVTVDGVTEMSVEVNELRGYIADWEFIDCTFNADDILTTLALEVDLGNQPEKGLQVSKYALPDPFYKANG